MGYSYWSLKGISWWGGHEGKGGQKAGGTGACHTPQSRLGWKVVRSLRFYRVCASTQKGDIGMGLQGPLERGGWNAATGRTGPALKRPEQGLTDLSQGLGRNPRRLNPSSGFVTGSSLSLLTPSLNYMGMGSGTPKASSVHHPDLRISLWPKPLAKDQEAAKGKTRVITRLSQWNGYHSSES